MVVREVDIMDEKAVGSLLGALVGSEDGTLDEYLVGALLGSFTG